ncbi:retropepsin-like aspartic protease family protein [Methylocystis sp. JAN1]|uniref:retropepsin-like aspartic protease family protein n=1 Tax=Methylocystis sp. JAN1 TaxID=3397211 RepID=UPI003FA3206E
MPLQIKADSAGHFWTEAEIDGARISRVLIDTGATFVVLTSRDAAAAGFSPDAAEFKHSTSTANGLARVARAKLRHVRVGEITIHDVDAYVALPGALTNSLLGMSFLSKLSRFTVDSGTLTLRK